MGQTNGKGLVPEAAPALDQTNPEVEVRIGEKTCTLHYTLRALRDLRADTGKNLLGVGLSPQDAGDPEFLAKLIFYGLKKHTPDITEDDILDSIDSKSLLYVLGQVMKALNVAMPVQESDVASPTPKPESDPTDAQISS